MRVRWSRATSAAVRDRGGIKLVGSSTLVWLAAILLVGGTLRAVIFAHAPVFLVPHDSPQFYDAAFSFATNGEFDLRAKRAPLYPLFLSGSIRLFGWQLEHAVLAQHALGLGTIVVTYLLGALAFGRAIGLFAAAVVAIDGGLMLIEQSLVSEALFTPLLAGALVLLLVALRSGGRRLLLAAGCVLGLAALTRPVSQVLLPLAFLAAILALPGWRLRLVAVGLLGLGYGLVVGPWLARNRLVHGTFAISAGLGDALFGRVHFYDREFDFRDHGLPPADARQAAIRARIFELARRLRTGPELRAILIREFGLGDAESDAALRDASLVVVRQEPNRFVRGTLEYFSNLAVAYRDPLPPLWWSRTREEYERAWPDQVRRALEAAPGRSDADYAIVAQVSSVYQDRYWGGLVGALFLIGSYACMAAGGIRSGRFLLPTVVVVLLLLYVALDGVQVRFRTPLQPLIAVVVAGGAGLVGRAAIGAARRRVAHLRDEPVEPTDLRLAGPAL